MPLDSTAQQASDATTRALDSERVASLEAELAAVYARNLRRVARIAAQNIRSYAVALTADAEFVMPDVDEILDPTRTEAVLNRGAHRLRVAVAQWVADEIHQEFGIAFDLGNPVMEGVIEQLGRKITAISESVRQDVMAELAEAYQQGEGIPEAAARVQTSISGASKLRGATIARTEVVGASNGASIAAVRIVDGAAYKTWIATNDDRTRDAHADADGQTVALHEPFDVDGESLDYPGDPNGSAENIINCRCTIGYTDDPDAIAASIATTEGADVPKTRDRIEPKLRDQLEKMAPAQRRGMARKIAAQVAEPMAIPEDANYREAADGATQTCANCGNYDAGTCTLYDAAVQADWVCDSWTAVDSGDASAEAVGWSAVLCAEGKPTEDGRMLHSQGGDWRTPPLPLMAMTKNPEGWDPGHGGAELAGRMDVLTRQGDTIEATGIFDSGEWGAEVARLVGEGFLTGVSIDPVVKAIEWVLWDNETDAVADENDVDPAEEEAAFWGESTRYRYIADFVEYTIVGATVCPMQALETATISLGDGEGAIVASLDDGVPRLRLFGTIKLRDAMTASALMPGLDAPPAEWFQDPDLDELTPMQITDEGRLFGHVAPWGTCHLGSTNACMEAPHSESDYSLFHLGEVVCAGGERVACGTFTINTTHPDLKLSRGATQNHYADTGLAAADVVVGEDEHGIWIAGAVRPDLDAAQLRRLRASKPSGDWRPVGRSGFELVGVLGVNVPGFPVPRVRLDASGNRVALVAGLAPPDPHTERRGREHTIAMAGLAARAAGGHDKAMERLVARVKR